MEGYGSSCCLEPTHARTHAYISHTLIHTYLILYSTVALPERCACFRPVMLSAFIDFVRSLLMKWNTVCTLCTVVDFKGLVGFVSWNDCDHILCTHEARLAKTLVRHNSNLD